MKDLVKIFKMRLILFLQLNPFRHSIKLKLHGQSLQNSGKIFIRNYFKHIFFTFLSIKIKKINKQMKAFSKSFHLSAIPFSQLFSFSHSVTLKLTCQLRFALRSYFFCNPRFRPPGTLFNTVAKRIELQQRDWSQLKALSKGFHYLVWFFSFYKF